MKAKTTFCLLLNLLLAFSVLAQNKDTTMQHHVVAERINDSIVELKISLFLPKEFCIMTTHANTADALVSSFENASSFKLDTIQEQGTLVKKKDSSLGLTLQYYKDSVTFIFPFHIPLDTSVNIKGVFNWLGLQGEAYPNGQIEINEQVKANIHKDSGVPISEIHPNGENEPAWKIFLTSFLIGLAMVFTPCVFPLIPVTVSFFLKKSKGRVDGIKNAVLYSIFIVFIYTIPAFIVTMIFGDAMLYKISTSVYANILFFFIFVIFAISFFGVFELTLPSKWANATDSGASKGGFLGIFFMALTLVIVSFSCTGPFVGSLLAKVSGSGAKMGAVVGMLGISSGLALPFSLFAFFPTMLKTLPKSGGWLNSVKVIFGFIELGLALKFFSNIDLIYGWRILDREIFLCIWIVLSFLAGMYLLGKIKFSHDAPISYISIPRLFFAIIVFTFGIYLVPGLWGAPLKAMSGLLPPVNTQDFDLNQLQYKISNSSTSFSHIENRTKAVAPKLYTDKIHEAPFGLTTYFDYDEGIAAAKALHKPVMLDFTGHSCTNCRKMENEVWSNPDVLQRLKNDFVIISLYTDENADLPVDQIYTNKKGEKITTLAEKSRDLESSKFGMISQPLYMFVDLNGTPLSEIKYSYNPDAQKFIAHLELVKSVFATR